MGHPLPPKSSARFHSFASFPTQDHGLAHDADGCWWIGFRTRSFIDAIPIPLLSSQLHINGGARVIGGCESEG